MSSLSDTDTVVPGADRVTVLLDALAKHAPVGHLDSLRNAVNSASLTPEWHAFFHSTLDTLAIQNYASDWKVALISRLTELNISLLRRIDDNGTSYNPYSDAVGQSRPWSLDLFPMIIGQADWQRIEAGVLQRADLLNRIMADVYGPQNLVRNGMLPSALVHGHPGYLRPVYGVKPLGGQFLHIAAFDLARGPDGNWWVMSQRTQAPSGLGYALENRLIVSRLFSDAFATLNVERLAESYKAFMASLAAHSPAGNNARIVLLTPGPYSETYFEHVYLARYLGTTLVEGADLVVREQRVWLKTLKGLEPVDVIIRRLDDDFLDPLELRADSALGVPGLMQTYRAGNVVLANAPGSEFLESCSTLGFLPRISEHLLGEPLKMPSIASWWCGERSTMRTLIPQLADYVIKPTFSDPVRRFVPAMGRSLSEREREQWISRIASHPEDYSAQAYMPLAHMPTWQGVSNQLSVPQSKSSQAVHIPIGSRAMMVRVFALSDGPGQWRVMPGGLTRIAPEDRDVVSMYRGGSSADLWAITGRSHNADDNRTLIAAPTQLTTQTQRASGSITSRAAENLFWLGRYTERLENAVRLALTVLEALSGESEDAAETLEWIHRLSISNGLVSRAVPTPRQAPHLFERALIASLTDRDAKLGAFSVANSLSLLRNAAFSVRERLAQEQWTLVTTATNEYETMLNRDTRATQQALRALERLSTNVMAMTGSQVDRMTRDDGWRMLSAGRQIERMTTLADALAQALVTGSINNELGFALNLNLFDSTITYRSQYRQQRDTQALVELLILDRDNPRSLAWISETLVGCIHKLNHSDDADGGEALTAVLAQTSLPHCWNADTLLTLARQRSHTQLADLLFGVGNSAYQISDALSQRYFSHAQSTHQTVGA